MMMDRTTVFLSNNDETSKIRRSINEPYRRRHHHRRRIFHHQSSRDEIRHHSRIPNFVVGVAIINVIYCLVIISTTTTSSSYVYASSSTKNPQSSQSSSSSSSSYVSSRALNEYGGLVQITNAYEATQRHGRLVVAAVVQQQQQFQQKPQFNDDTQEKNVEKINNATAAATTTTTTTPLPPSSSSSFIVVVSIGATPILQPLKLPLVSQDTTTPSSSSSSLLAMCCTGVRGDVRWLTTEVQRYMATIWNRYDTTTTMSNFGGTKSTSTPSAAYIVSHLKSRFVQHDETKEYMSSIGPPAPTYRNNDSSDERNVNVHNMWSRPFGVRTMILSVTPPTTGRTHTQYNENFNDSNPPLLIVDPSGRILQPKSTTKTITTTETNGTIRRTIVSIGAMGKGSDVIEKRLLELFATDNDNSGNNNNKKEGFLAWVTPSPSNNDSGAGNEEISWEKRPPTLDECKRSLVDIVMEKVLSDAATSSNSSSKKGTGSGGGGFFNRLGSGSDNTNRKNRIHLDGNLVVETFSSSTGVLNYQVLPYNSFYAE